MKLYNYQRALLYFVGLVSMINAATSCTKLHEQLNSSLDSTQAAKFSSLFLQGAYNDVGLIYADPGNTFQLEEVSGDQCFIPIRGGDWYDGGYHVQLHLHNWTRTSLSNAGITHGQFTAINKLNFDATTVLGTNGTNDQFAQARFLRALSCYQLLDLFGQFPLRQPGDNLLLPSKVYAGDSAVQFLISELNYSIANLNATNGTAIANVNAARALLMKVYLQRGAFLNLAAPTFADADMQQVITLGNAIISSGGYNFGSNYFDAFNATNSATPEAIFSLPAVPKAKPYFPNLQNRWFVTLNYNSYDGGTLKGSAGWNGYAAMGDFYNTFGVNGTTLTQTPADTSVDQRIGGRYYSGVTDKSGLRTGLLLGQQYNEAHQALYGFRQPSVPLSFSNGEETPANLDVTLLPNYESVGIRVLKYLPDFTNVSNPSASYQAPGNYLLMLRYADVLLMIAEAKMRRASPDNAGALTLVNQIRAARKATALTSMSLVNVNNVYDPNTLLAERGRELYWEGQRRTDLIRFGVFAAAFFRHTADAGKYYIFPLAQQDLDANPNLHANIQGSAY